MSNIEVFWVCLLGLWLTNGLVAFAISLSKLHWFLKLALLAGLAGLMTFIEAPDLRLIALLQGWTTFFIAAAGGLWQSQKQPATGELSLSSFGRIPTLSMMDTMLGVAIFAVLVAACSSDFSNYFPLEYSALFGVLLGLIPILAFWLANIKQGWCVAVGCLGCIAGGILIPKIIFRPSQGFLTGLFGHEFIWGGETDFALSTLIANTIAWFSLGLLWRLSKCDSQYLKSVTSLLGLAVLATVSILSIATVHLYFSLTNGPVVAWPAKTVDDQVNGFDELVAIAEKLRSSQILEDTDLASGGDRLANEVAAYSREFEAIEQALRRPKLTAEITSIDQFKSLVENTPKLRTIARSLTCRAIQFAHEGKADLALNDIGSIAKLSIPLRRGRTNFTELIASALEGMAHWQSIEVIPDASSESLRAALSRFAEIAPTAEHFGEVLENNAAITWNYQTWQGRLASIAGREDAEKNKEVFISTVKRRDSTRQQVVTLIAIELFRRQNKRYPHELVELVPNFLDHVPPDPFSAAGNSSLVYRLTFEGDSFELYSFGPDRDDDLGKLSSTGFAHEDGDLNFQAIIKYQDATSGAERQSLVIPNPWAEGGDYYSDDDELLNLDQ